MLHPEVLRQLARERQDAFKEDARRDRQAREAKAAAHDDRPDRFDVRRLRWPLVARPSGA